MISNTISSNLRVLLYLYNKRIRQAYRNVNFVVCTTLGNYHSN
ncbi:TPA: hypothetical protein GRI76_04335 [Vibrio parahaemolyticus]|nr:hypothetical protein [Vibrio parahaemolyticus]HAS6757141.1 hypothetical protein [Vibrio parahaemolyticus]HAS6767518.1 hypothetical protein [Vibrio parahaemolyticus]